MGIKLLRFWCIFELKGVNLGEYQITSFLMARVIKLEIKGLDLEECIPPKRRTHIWDYSLWW